MNSCGVKTWIFIHGSRIDCTVLSSQHDLILHAGGRDQDVQIVLALKPLLDDIHMEQAQKANPEPEIERLGRLRLVDERGVV